MRFVVRHLTEYRYATPVVLSPHLLRLSPRPGAVRVEDHEIAVSPDPSLHVHETDARGNLVTRLHFDGPTPHLRIESRFTLDTEAPAPRAAPLPALPWSDAAADPELSGYLGSGAEDDSVAAFAAGLLAEAGGDVGDFLDRLNRDLFTGTDRRIRPQGYAQGPAETLAIRRGACRDLTVLFMAACRSLGIPARFVSGYQAHAETPDGQRHLHAWAEVHLPGQGWRGYDPTHGLPVTDGHVALCAAPDQAGTMPLEGGYYGPPVAATLDYAVEIATDG